LTHAVLGLVLLLLATGLVLLGTIRVARAFGLTDTIDLAVAASVLAAECVDRLIIFQAPIVLGAGSLGAFSGIAPHDLANAPRFHALRTERFGDDVMTIYSPMHS